MVGEIKMDYVTPELNQLSEIVEYFEWLINEDNKCWRKYREDCRHKILEVMLSLQLRDFKND
jgi:hypothetical protein